MAHVYLVYEHHTPPWFLDNREPETTLRGIFTEQQSAQALVDKLQSLERDLKLDESLEFQICQYALDMEC